MPNNRARRTRAEIAAQRAFGQKRRRRKVLPRQVAPRGIQLAYARALLKIISKARSELQPLIDELPRLTRGVAEEQRRFDAGEGRRISELVDQAGSSLQGTVATPELDRIAKSFANRTEAWQSAQMGKQVRAALGIDVFASGEGMSAAAEAFVAENVSLIKDLPRQMYGEIERLVQREVAAGSLHKNIAKQIQDRFKIAEGRAKLIARDQVGKYYGKVNEVRQRNLGVERFVWRTVGDERVRGEHSSRDGVIYSWASAPEGGPGQPINCRCYPEPVLDDLV